MPQQLTDEYIDALEFSGQRQDYSDDSTPFTFGIRVSKTGKQWYTRYKIGSRHPRVPLGWYPAVKRDEAMLKAMRVKVQVADGLDPAAERRRRKSSKTVAEMAWRYLEKAKPVFEVTKPVEERQASKSKNHLRLRSKKAWQARCSLVRRIVEPSIGSWRLVDIRHSDLYAILEDLAETKPGAANMLHCVFRRMFQLAVRSGELEYNPTQDLLKPGIEVARNRVLEPEEIRAIWEAACKRAETEPAYAVMLVLMSTGQRRTEVRTMDLDDITGRWWKLGQDHAATTKNEQRHTVFLTDTVWSLIEPWVDISERSTRLPQRPSWPRAKKPHLPIIDDDVQDCLSRIRSEVGIPYWRLHDFRHTFVTWLKEQEIETYLSNALVNHSTRGTNARYTHAKWRPARQKWFERYSRYIQQCVSGSVADVVPFDLHRR